MLGLSSSVTVGLASVRAETRPTRSRRNFMHRLGRASAQQWVHRDNRRNRRHAGRQDAARRACGIGLLPHGRNHRLCHRRSVRAQSIPRLISQNPDALGLAVPGMLIGSPSLAIEGGHMASSRPWASVARQAIGRSEVDLPRGRHCPAQSECAKGPAEQDPFFSKYSAYSRLPNKESSMVNMLMKSR